jgi:hypothetical protein
MDENFCHQPATGRRDGGVLGGIQAGGEVDFFAPRGGCHGGSLHRHGLRAGSRSK